MIQKQSRSRRYEEVHHPGGESYAFCSVNTKTLRPIYPSNEIQAALITMSQITCPKFSPKTDFGRAHQQQASHHRLQGDPA